GATSASIIATTANGGAAGGTAVTPVLAISVASISTKAAIGASATLILNGDVSAHATETSSNVTTQAKGDANGTSTAVGAALALGFDRDEVIATTASSFTTTGTVELVAVGAATTATTAEASADGSQPSG